MNKNELEIWQFEIHLKNFFLPSNLSNDDIIFALRPGLKTGMYFRGLV